MKEQYRPTRYAELRYVQDDRRLWRIVDAETDARIGPLYASKSELLADLERFAKVYGCA